MYSSYTHTVQTLLATSRTPQTQKQAPKRLWSPVTKSTGLKDVSYLKPDECAKENQTNTKSGTASAFQKENYCSVMPSNKGSIKKVFMKNVLPKH